jgi:hypothetical protein
MPDDLHFERLLGGTPGMAEELLLIFCEEFRSPRGTVRLEKVHGSFGEAFDVKAATGHSIGRFKLVGFPGTRVLLKSLALHVEVDPDGSYFGEFCDYLVRRCEEYGLLSRRTRFACAGMVDTASRQLAAADAPEGFAAIGNVCRTALTSIGRELFDPEMLAVGEDAPPADAAGVMLKIVVRFHWGARSTRQLNSIERLIDGTWGMAVSSLHRQHATREEAEITVLATATLFDVLALVLA